MKVMNPLALQIKYFFCESIEKIIEKFLEYWLLKHAYCCGRGEINGVANFRAAILSFLLQPSYNRIIVHCQLLFTNIYLLIFSVLDTEIRLSYILGKHSDIPSPLKNMLCHGGEAFGSQAGRFCKVLKLARDAALVEGLPNTVKILSLIPSTAEQNKKQV